MKHKRCRWDPTILRRARLGALRTPSQPTTQNSNPNGEAMSAAATIFFLTKSADDKRRTVTFEVGNSPRTFDAAGGRDLVKAALMALKGEPVVEMTHGAPQVGEVVEITEAGQRLQVVAAITAPDAWRKVQAHVYKGARVNLYGAEAGKPYYSGRLMLADVPTPEDVILRSVTAHPGAEVALVVDEAYAAMRDLKRYAAEGSLRLAEYHASFTRADRVH